MSEKKKEKENEQNLLKEKVKELKKDNSQNFKNKKIVVKKNKRKKQAGLTKEK